MTAKSAEPRDRTQMEQGTQATSSRLFDLIGLKGKTTEPGPGPLPCEGYEDGTIQMIHPWSIYDLPFEELEKGYATMRTTLPKEGWKVVSDGPAANRAKTPTIVADSPDGDYSAELQLVDRRKDPTAKTKFVLSVTVVSRCFQPS
ncbi:hypothetical protein AB0A05_24870 [Streptomyces sp. NPDC046374]|uniref:hypothetical protein n=1 Tax=unclassified Streptomyces TaxID=2593676 RepID=UPI0033C3A88B